MEEILMVICLEDQISEAFHISNLQNKNPSNDR